MEFLESCRKDQYVSLGYCELANRPIQSIGRVFNFLGISEEQNVWNFLDERIEPRHRKVRRDLSALEREIGGNYLEAVLALEKECSIADAQQFAAGPTAS